MSEESQPIQRRWKSIVVKVGTSTLTAGSERLYPPRMVDLVREVYELRRDGADVVLVSSGAQQAGRERLGYPLDRDRLDRSSIPHKQLLAAVGQGRLMQLWEQYFDLYDLIVAQVLLTRDDIEDRSRYLSLRDTFESLLREGIVPIVNENDAVATDEIKVGENDSLSAMVANLIDAELLVLLTDTDGLFTSDPAMDPDARLVDRVDRIDQSVYALATGTGSELGTGGMYTKIVAADMAVRCGTTVVIANGGRENVLRGVWEQSIPATWFPAEISPREGRKRWLLAQKTPAASVTVDDGAAHALVRRGTSLLPVGIVSVNGGFERGAIVSVKHGQDQEIARGIGSYSSDDLRRIVGQQSRDIADILGYDYGPEFIHRDKLTLIGDLSE